MSNTRLLILLFILLLALLPASRADTQANSPYITYSVVWCKWLGGSQSAASCSGSPLNLVVGDTILIKTNFKNVSPYNLTINIVAQIRNSTGISLANANFAFNVWYNTTSLNLYYYTFTKTQIYVWNATFTVTQYNATTSPIFAYHSDLLPPQVYHEERRWNVTANALSIKPFLPFITLIPILTVKRLRRR